MDLFCNKWISQRIDAKHKNKHRRSRNKVRRVRRRPNLPQQYYHFIVSTNVREDIPIWQCTQCTYINTERRGHCAMCQLPYSQQNNENDSDSDTSISSSSSSSCTPSITLSSYIQHARKSKHKGRRRKFHRKLGETKNAFKFNDDDYKKFKKFMDKHKTSIIAEKHGKTHDSNLSHAKIQRQQKSATHLFEMYKTLYLSQIATHNEIARILPQLMASFVPKRYLKQNGQRVADSEICKVCYTSTADDNSLRLVAMNAYCSHCMICEDCFRQYLSITIKDEENILPWLLCPAPDCKAPINIDLLLQFARLQDLRSFALCFINKHLQRTKYWLECPDSHDVKCKFGWIVINENESKHDEEMQLKCEACGCLHKLEREEQPRDSKHIAKNTGFAELIGSGIMRECPECSYPAMKDYGMCNVMQCGKCGVYWNWRTKQTGSSSSEVKQRARNEGTLWEPGELSYQQDLEANNLPQFITLLQRNGIRYDPNYRRGT